MLTHSPTKSLLFKATAVAAILAIMPARAIEGQADYNVAVKHTEAATLELRRLGYVAPSPIVSYYDWPKFKGVFAPFDHQRVMAEFMTLHWRCFNLSGMGTAKTNAALWAADYMMKIGRIKKCLIIAPLSVLERVWGKSIFNTLMHRNSAIVHGSREKRRQMLALDVDFYIINHEGPSIKEVREAINARPDINMVIVDEGHKFRNYDTDKYRNLKALVGMPDAPKHGRGLWWLTGTPTPNAPLDAWSQAKLVNKGFDVNYGSFRTSTMMEVSQHIWKPRADGYKHAFNAMQPAIRFEKDECMDLPPMTTEDWECELSPAQKKAYKAMAEDMVMATEDGQRVTAQNAADRVAKLRQILIGSIKVGDDDYDALDCRPRVEMLMDAIAGAKGKTYVIVPYKGAIRALEKQLAERGVRVAMVNGDVSISKRNRIFADFENPTTGPDVLLCHPAVVAVGLDFTVCDTLVFFGPIYSNDDFRQVLERMNRPGQTRKMTAIRIGGTKLEWAIYAKPDARELTQSALMELYNIARTLH